MRHGGDLDQLDLDPDQARRKASSATARPAPDELRFDERWLALVLLATQTNADLVRRAILARLSLRLIGRGRSAAARRWDALVSDDATRANWRTSWHDKLAALGER